VKIPSKDLLSARISGRCAPRPWAPEGLAKPELIE
jgi:hypothetical protein